MHEAISRDRGEIEVHQTNAAQGQVDRRQRVVDEIHRFEADPRHAPSRSDDPLQRTSARKGETPVAGTSARRAARPYRPENRVTEMLRSRLQAPSHSRMMREHKHA